MGKPKPLPAVAEVPPEALAEDRRRAEAMVAHGVDYLDVGGESTRPGSSPPSLH